jgi:single-stranded-DNA-specific exonuclease RecJ
MQKRRDLYKKLSKKNKDFIENYLENILKLPKEKWEEFLFPEYEKHLHDFSEMKDMGKAIERFIQAIEKNEKICIYGDYDCDGVPGVAMFRDFLEKLNYTNAIYYIPHRHKEGYGLNIPAIEKLAKEKVKLMITIDLGITNIKEIDFANEKKIDVIVTDHHLPIENEDGQILPKAFAIINNKQAGDEYKFKELCGSGTTWKFICGIIEELKSRPLKPSLPASLQRREETSSTNRDKIKPYNKELVELSKKNRTFSTEHEKIFWELVRANRIGYDFVRQKPIDNFILDFYCKELNLGIEIDGEYHNNYSEKTRDLERQKIIENYDIKIIRFTNAEIEKITKEELEEKVKQEYATKNNFSNKNKVATLSNGEGLRDSEGERVALNSIPPGYEKWLLDMVGVATISDLVPLHGENRVLAIYGMHVLSQTKRQGLRKIFVKNNVQIEKVGEQDIAFTLAPRINAASRMAHPEVALRMLSTNLEESLQGAEELESLNKNRKESVASIMKKVHTRIEERILQSKLPEIVVIGDRDWGAGILGLIASQIVDKYKVNAFVWGGMSTAAHSELFSSEKPSPKFFQEEQEKFLLSKGEELEQRNENILKGSCRSNGEAHMVKLMTDATHLFTHFGGHEMSGGFAINLENIFELEKTLNEIFNKDRKAHIEKKESDKKNEPIKIFLEEINQELLNTLSLLGPFGVGNQVPTFQIKNITNVQVERFGKNKEHVKMLLSNKPSPNLSSGEAQNIRVSREAIKFFCDENLQNILENTNPEKIVFNVEAGFRSSAPRLRIVEILD